MASGPPAQPSEGFRTQALLLIVDDDQFLDECRIRMALKGLKQTYQQVLFPIMDDYQGNPHGL